jgi:imidazolonepropionase
VTSADLLIEHASLIATCAGPAPRRGAAQREINSFANGTIASRDGVIVYVGPASGVDGHGEALAGATRVDASGCVVVPGFVDPHTHVVFAGDRRAELRDRLAGATYAEIAAAGGGILRTVAATREAPPDELVAAALPRLDEMLANGTTTCEVKSGYGLTTESEVRQLRAIRTLDSMHAMDLVPTLLGAHEIPREFERSRAAYVSLVIEEMIPRVAAEGLAAWCDVFCEDGVFTPAESQAILEAGKRAGLGARIHADELGPSGGSLVAARVGARSADHLIYCDRAGAEALAAAGVCAVLLPASAFYLKLGRFAPARMLIDAAVPIALGTDVNPGGGCSPSMPFAMSLACFAMNMTLEESLVAATLNAAWSLNRSDLIGSLEVGKMMDAVVIRGGLTELLRVGAPAVRTVVKRGKVVAG